MSYIYEIMRYLVIIILLASCALTSKYDSTDKSYLKLLTEEEKEQILKEGNIFKSYKLMNNSTNEIDKHDLRISFNHQKNRYNFVRIGTYVYNYYSPSDLPFVKGTYHIDTLTVDDYGNVVYRAHYQRKKSEAKFYLEERWTHELTDSKFIQYYTIFLPNNRKLWEGSYLIKDFQEIKFYQDKTKAKYGNWIFYDEQGDVEKIEVYDDYGNLMSREKL